MKNLGQSFLSVIGANIITRTITRRKINSERNYYERSYRSPLFRDTQ